MSTLCLSAVLSLAPTAASLAGVPVDEPPRVVVHVSDLNLRSESGVQRLYARLENAARVVCDDGASREIAQIVAARRCMQATLRDAVESVHLDSLSEAYMRHNAYRWG
jgi:UrcA family protein